MRAFAPTSRAAHATAWRDPEPAQVRLHLGAVVDQAAALVLLHHLEGKRGIEHDGIDVARQHVGHEAAAAERDRRELHLPVLHGPAREHVGRRSGRRDADLLAVQVGHLGDLGVRLDHQIPAEISERSAGDRLGVHALAAPRGNERRRVELHIGRARGHRLERFGAAAIDRQFGLDALLVEQFLAQRRLGDDGRIVGLRRQPDAHDLLLGVGRHARQRRQAERGGAGRDQRPAVHVHGRLPPDLLFLAAYFGSASSRTTQFSSPGRAAG